MGMTLTQLISAAEQAQEEFGDIEVRLAHQPNWPMELSVGGALAVEDEEGAEFGDPSQEHDPVFYIMEQEQVGYLPDHVKEVAGW